jgi:DNA-binding GntR family transcriptional regulator
MSTASAHALPRGPAPSNVMVVAQALRKAIAEGGFAPGERIKEIPLAQRMGISRGPIRDALRLLHEEGLVEISPNRGAIVPEVRAVDVVEVYALRATLGSLAMHKLMLDANPAAIARLDAPLRRLERAVERRDERRAVDADLAFQTALVEGAGLPRVAREFDRLTWQVRMFIATLAMRYEAELPAMAEELRAIHAAIVAADRVRAHARWHEKFERWMRHFVGRLDGEELDAGLWTALIEAPDPRERDGAARPPTRGGGGRDKRRRSAGA